MYLICVFQTGFKAAQEERFRNERKPARIQLDPIKLEDGKQPYNFYRNYAHLNMSTV